MAAVPDRGPAELDLDELEALDYREEEELSGELVLLPTPLPASVEHERAEEPLRLSLIVPATDDPATLELCLEAIESSIDTPAEVIVVREAAGPGAAAARNHGAALATGDILVFVDADVVAHADAIGRLHAHFMRRPDTAAVFGSYDDAPRDEGTVSGFRNLLHHHVHQRSGGPIGTFWAGLGAIRRDAFEAVGGFDADRYPTASVEDIDLGVRLAAAGYEIVLDPTILGTHLKPWSLTDMVATDFFRRGVPWIELILRHGRGSDELNLGWRHRASALAVVIAAVAAGGGKPRAAASGAATFVALNLPFYALLQRQCGTPSAAAGVGLHALHHAVAIAAVPYGLAKHWRTRVRLRAPRS